MRVAVLRERKTEKEREREPPRIPRTSIRPRARSLHRGGKVTVGCFGVWVVGWGAWGYGVWV